VPDPLLRRNRSPGTPGIHQPSGSDYARLCGPSLEIRGHHAFALLPDAGTRIDSHRERLYRAAAGLSHRDAHFSSGYAVHYPQFYPPYRSYGNALCRAVTNHGASLDLHSVTYFRAVFLSREFCELSHHTQNSLARFGIRVDWAGANANRFILKLPQGALARMFSTGHGTVSFFYSVSCRAN